jgi:outer membrane protein OmpA-like peptidoglycan-associated protein
VLYLLICIFLYQVAPILAGDLPATLANQSADSGSSWSVASASPGLAGEKPDTGLRGDGALSKKHPTEFLPHFLRHSFLFCPESLELAPPSEQRLELDARWVREHRRVRILAVGYCDTLGSEECTHELAERRAVVVKEYLLRYGVDPSQIIAVKAWEQADPACGSRTPTCQQMNRRARIFLVGSADARH